MSNSNCLASNDWITMNRKDIEGNGRGTNYVVTLGCSWEDLRKTTINIIQDSVSNLTKRLQVTT
jgi:hypothetical protein